MLYLGFELLAAFAIVLYLSRQDGKFSLREGVQRLRGIVKAVSLAPATALRVHDLECKNQTLALRIQNLEKTVTNVLLEQERLQIRHDRAFQEANDYFIDRLTYEKDQNFILKELKHSAEGVLGVVRAIKSLEKSLEARLTPTAPKKGSRAKLKVVKKGR